ncbi:hypothetical protein CLOM_g18990 [Closterium sp. NIES-68]|nr:hypothetical protein CLOM_g18990 [Closterium sp. NIES-68]GJP66170.1 hypothetical protein CLOP_g23075 [Closterium sp. NIES-67]
MLPARALPAFRCTAHSIRGAHHVHAGTPISSERRNRLRTSRTLAEGTAEPFAVGERGEERASLRLKDESPDEATNGSLQMSPRLLDDGLAEPPAAEGRGEERASLRRLEISSLRALEEGPADTFATGERGEEGGGRRRELLPQPQSAEPQSAEPQSAEPQSAEPQSPKAFGSRMHLHEAVRPSSEVAGKAAAPQQARRVLLLPQSPEQFGSGMQLHEALAPLWEMAARVAVNGTVLVVVFNAGYTDMLDNWARHVSNVGLGANFILFAEDEESLRFGQARWPGQTIHLDLPDQSVTASWQSFQATNPQAQTSNSHSSARAGTPAFHLLAARRILYLLHLLSFGFNVLYSDTDVAILRNPLPEVSDPKQVFDAYVTLDGYERNWQKKTVMIEGYGVKNIADQKLSVSTSFIFFRPTSGAKCLVGDWSNRVMELGRDQGTDQEHLNSLIVEMDAFKILPRIAVLPAQKFLAGQLLVEDDWAAVEVLKSELVTVHAGGLMGRDAKRQALKKLGFWIVGGGTGGLDADFGESGAAGGEPAAPAADAAAAAATASGGGKPLGGGLDGIPEVGMESEPVTLLNADSTWPSTSETSSISSSRTTSSSSFGGDKGPFCVGLLCPEMHLSQEEVVLLSVQPWVQRHLEKIDALVPEVASTSRFVIVTVACPGQGRLFANWFNNMHSAAMAENVIASVAPEVESMGLNILQQPEGSESPHKAALTCLLLPSLLMEKVLKLNYSVIYSDISSVWLQDPLPFLPPEFNAALPSSVPSSTQPPPSNNKLDSKLKRTTPLSRSDLGYFSPWFVALRPSHPIFLMLREWAILTLEDYREKAAAAHKASLPLSLSASESIKVGLNEAITRMVEGGEPGSNVGVLSRFLFPPVWKVMGEREWFARHREEVVAVPNDCGEDVSHREMCFKDLKLWV